MPHEVPPLGYAFDALEPHIDAKTMEIHHDKHHAAYVTNLNKALESSPDLQKKSVEDLLRGINTVPEAIRTAVRNHGGGHHNHTLFWEIMGPGGGGKPAGDLAKAIDQAFGGFDGFKEKLTAAATGQFGSGWGWLVVVGRQEARGDQSAQSGQPADGGQDADSGRRRVGARLLPQVPEPPPRLPVGLVEHHEVGQRRQALRAGEPLTEGER